MPTVMRFGGYRVVVYSNDHRPAHVHVMGSGCEAIFRLHCPEGPPVLRENFGFSPQTLRGIIAELIAALPALCAAWSAIHGHA